MRQFDDGLHANLAALLQGVIERWPEHERALDKSFARRDSADLAHAERLSALILQLAATIDGGLVAVIDGYRFLCEEIVLAEELFFRREGRYRLSRFEDALRTVYNDKVFMTRYMNGLLASSVLWANHARAFRHYAEQFLPSLRAGTDLLEIGPGHGLLLYLASARTNLRSVGGWDISDASLSATRHALDALGAPRPVLLERHNIFEPSILSAENGGRFDAIVFSEVLEHLERPDDALKVLRHLLRPGGQVWINVPANSPAPDHLYLIRQPSEAVRLVEEGGFRVVTSEGFAMNDTALDRAIRQELTISCIVVGEKP